MSKSEQVCISLLNEINKKDTITLTELRQKSLILSTYAPLIKYVNLMLADGLIEKKQNKYDKREILIKLTFKGKDMLEKNKLEPRTLKEKIKAMAKEMDEISAEILHGER